MGFEYDSEKSAENKRKHRVDFEEAQALWSDSALLEIPARVTDEPRWVVIGKMNEKHWSALVSIGQRWSRGVATMCELFQ
jgi:uncharacterized DUF497 family protein